MMKGVPRPIAVLFFLFSAGVAVGAPIVADHTAADQFIQIPSTYFQDIRDHYRFFYGHTSHGSQICTGIDILQAQDPILYADVTMVEYGSDLGHLGDVSWVAPTRSYLDAHPECNAVMWSWCGGASDNTVEGIDAYLQAMNQLELDYPGVLFVYMTGHLDGTGPSGNLYQRNNQIRAWCTAHEKVLFDFADIESWDPAGIYYPNDNDGCDWCYTWCSTNPCPGCGDCAHSHCFNCYRKGRAFWWMMARGRGWSPVSAAVEPAPALSSTRARPNPFGSATAISFSLPAAGAVRVLILDATGRRLAVLVDETLAAGPHEFTWSGLDETGRAAPAGVYFSILEIGGEAQTQKIVLVR
jgi:hypothetical protein